MNGLVGSGKWFDEVRVGDTFASALTLALMRAGLNPSLRPRSAAR